MFEGEKEIASDKKDATGKPLPGTKVKVNQLSLNEIFLAERDVASASLRDKTLECLRLQVCLLAQVLEVRVGCTLQDR